MRKIYIKLRHTDIKQYDVKVFIYIRGGVLFCNFFLMEYPLKTWTCYARVQKYNFLTGRLILTPLCIPSEGHAPQNTSKMV